MRQPLPQPHPYLVISFVVCGFLANAAFWKMVAEVNAQLPPAQKFRWWWTFSKHLRLWEEHRRLYPDSNLRRYSILFFALAIVLMFAAIFGVRPM